MGSCSHAGVDEGGVLDANNQRNEIGQMKRVVGVITNLWEEPVKKYLDEIMCNAVIDATVIYKSRRHQKETHDPWMHILYICCRVAMYVATVKPFAWVNFF